MSDAELRPKNMFVLFRLIGLVFVIPILVFFWVHLIAGYSLELGIILAAICFIIFGFIFLEIFITKSIIL